MSFNRSYTLVWFTLVSAVVLQVAALAVMGEAAVGVLMTSIPAQLGLVAAWTHTTNKTEIETKKLEVVP